MGRVSRRLFGKIGLGAPLAAMAGVSHAKQPGETFSGEVQSLGHFDTFDGLKVIPPRQAISEKIERLKTDKRNRALCKAFGVQEISEESSLGFNVYSQAIREAGIDSFRSVSPVAKAMMMLNRQERDKSKHDPIDLEISRLQKILGMNDDLISWFWGRF